MNATTRPITTGYEFEQVVRSHLPPSAVQPPREGQTPEEALQARRDAVARTIGQVYEHGPLPLDAQVLAAAYYQIAQQPASTDPQLEARRETCAQLCYLLGGPPALEEPDLAPVVLLWTKRAAEIEAQAGEAIDGRTKAIVATLRREADILAEIDDDDEDENEDEDEDAENPVTLAHLLEASRDLRDRALRLAAGLTLQDGLKTADGSDPCGACLEKAVQLAQLAAESANGCADKILEVRKGHGLKGSGVFEVKNPKDMQELISFLEGLAAARGAQPAEAPPA